MAGFTAYRPPPSTGLAAAQGTAYGPGTAAPSYAPSAYPTVGSYGLPNTPGANAVPYTAPKTAAAPTASGTAAGTPPDYTTLINQDPFYQQAQANIAAQHAADLASRNASAQQALIRAGFDPGNLLTAFGADANAIADAATRSLIAQGNTAGTSVNAQLIHTHDLHNRDLVNRLTAHGIIGSGETGYELGQEQQGYQTAEYDARNKLLDYLAGTQGNYTSAERARQQDLLNAAQSAYQNQLNLWMLTHQGGTGAVPAGASGSGAGPSPSTGLAAAQGAAYGQTPYTPTPSMADTLSQEWLARQAAMAGQPWTAGM